MLETSAHRRGVHFSCEHRRVSRSFGVWSTGFVHQSGPPGQFNIADQFPRRVGGQGRAVLVPPLGLPHQTVIADPLPALIGSAAISSGMLCCTGVRQIASNRLHNRNGAAVLNAHFILGFG